MWTSNFIAIQEAYHNTGKQDQIKNLILHLNNLEKEEKESWNRQSQQKETNYKEQSRTKWKRNEGNTCKDQPTGR